MQIKLLTFILLCILNLSISAQQQLYLNGQILDVKTNKPIPFATISKTNSYYGVVSNDDGSFILPVNVADSSISIQIRSVGYEPITTNISEKDLHALQFFRLNPKNYELKELLIKGKKITRKSALEMVSLAVNGIELNYPNHPFLLKGYYRDYIKIDEQYINLYEAAVEVEDMGFNTSDDQTKISLIYGSINKSFAIDYTKIVNYGNNKIIPHGNTSYSGGNEFFFLLTHNPIRNFKDKSFDFIKYIQSDFLNDHRFKIVGIEPIDGVPCYRVEFIYYRPEDNKYETGYARTTHGDIPDYSNYSANGYIYIQANNQKIHKLVYRVYYDTKGEKVKLWELNLEYRNREGIPYLNYLSFNNIIEIPQYDNHKYFFLKNFIVDKQCEMVKLIFNNKVDSLSALKLKNYKLEFDGNKLNIKKITISDTCVSLTIKDFKILFGSFEMKYSNRLNISVKNIKDCIGNRVNDLKSTKAYQYREFFVNDVSTDFQPIPKGRCLDRMRSMIFIKNKNMKLPDGIIFNSPLIDKNK